MHIVLVYYQVMGDRSFSEFGFKNKLEIKGLPPYSIEKITPEIIFSLKNSGASRIWRGHTSEVHEGESKCSLDANPCVTGVVISRRGEIYIIHTNQEQFMPPDQELKEPGQWQLIQDARWGIIGGGWATLKSCEKALAKTKVRAIWSGNENPMGESFNVAVIRRELPGVKPGIYLGYLQDIF